MATRSTIAIEYADGTVGQVYCHWDGYLDHNGKLLQEHYSNPFKLRDLIDLGDISSLGENIGERHPFSPFGDGDKAAYDEAKDGGATTFYGRDRGETGCGAKTFKSIEDYRENVYGEEYDYILCQREGKAQWFVRYYATEGNWVALEVAFEEQAKEEELA